MTRVELEDAYEGWRAWWVGRDALLHSVEQPYVWTPKRAAVADCPFGCGKLGCPGPTCHCGFVSVRTLDLLLSMGYPQAPPDCVGVVGEVAVWGNVVEGNLGWRSSRAYPTRLWVPHEALPLATTLQEGYGCKVGVKTFEGVAT